jgi:hypothetical protein
MVQGGIGNYEGDRIIPEGEVSDVTAEIFTWVDAVSAGSTSRPAYYFMRDIYSDYVAVDLAEVEEKLVRARSFLKKVSLQNIPGISRIRPSRYQVEIGLLLVLSKQLIGVAFLNPFSSDMVPMLSPAS